MQVPDLNDTLTDGTPFDLSAVGRALPLLPPRLQILDKNNHALKEEILHGKKEKRSSRNQDSTLIFECVTQGNLEAFKMWLKTAEECPEKKFIVISVTDADVSKKLPNVEHLILDVPDDHTAWTCQSGIKNNLTTIFQLFDKSRIHNIPLLIHCTAGISRSSAVLSSYLMWSCSLRHEQVLSFIKSKRIWANPSEDLKAILSTDFHDLLVQEGILDKY